MSDDKKDIGTELSEKLSKLVNEKPTKRANNDIYERFISRVQDAENNNKDEYNKKDEETGQTQSLAQSKAQSKSLEMANRLPAYEPLSEEELGLFEAKNPAVKNDVSSNRDSDDVDSERLDNHLDDQHLDDTSSSETKKTFFVEADQVAEVPSISNTPALEGPSGPIEQSIKPEKESTKSLASSKKPLIVGMILGSLLIAGVVLALIFTGILSTSSDVVDSNVSDSVDANATAATNNKPATSTVSAPKKEEKTAATGTNTTTEALTPSQQPSNDSKKAAPANSEETPMTTGNADSLDSSGLTYEDFQQESQSTLYRETDN